jgi:DTW domain-containing protein YfiP
MPRSVVLAGAARCPRCCQQPRWCVCDAVPPVATSLQVHVLMHRHEQYKPSSTGRLIARAVEGARCHLYQRGNHFFPSAGLSASDLLAERETWILHPQGESVSAADVADTGRLPQVVLLDGTWREAGEMQRAVDGMGRCVRLPASGPGRYWLRDHDAPAHVSTAEALLAVLGIVGDEEAARRFRLHFELHVYATLLSRGHRDVADRYLATSPLREAIPEFLEHLTRRRSMSGPSSPNVSLEQGDEASS